MASFSFGGEDGTQDGTPEFSFVDRLDSSPSFLISKEDQPSNTINNTSGNRSDSSTKRFHRRTSKKSPTCSRSIFKTESPVLSTSDVSKALFTFSEQYKPNNISTTSQSGATSSIATTSTATNVKFPTSIPERGLSWKGDSPCETGFSMITTDSNHKHNEGLSSDIGSFSNFEPSKFGGSVMSYPTFTSPTASFSLQNSSEITSNTSTTNKKPCSQSRKILSNSTQASGLAPATVASGLNGFGYSHTASKASPILRPAIFTPPKTTAPLFRWFSPTTDTVSEHSPQTNLFSSSSQTKPNIFTPLTNNNMSHNMSSPQSTEPVTPSRRKLEAGEDPSTFGSHTTSQSVFRPSNRPTSPSSCTTSSLFYRSTSPSYIATSPSSYTSTSPSYTPISPSYTPINPSTYTPISPAFSPSPPKFDFANGREWNSPVASSSFFNPLAAKKEKGTKPKIETKKKDNEKASNNRTCKEKEKKNTPSTLSDQSKEISTLNDSVREFKVLLRELNGIRAFNDIRTISMMIESLEKNMRSIREVFKCEICFLSQYNHFYFCQECGRLVGCFLCAYRLDRCPTCRKRLPPKKSRSPHVIPGLAGALDEKEMTREELWKKVEDIKL